MILPIDFDIELDNDAMATLFIDGQETNMKMALAVALSKINELVEAQQ